MIELNLNNGHVKINGSTAVEPKISLETLTKMLPDYQIELFYNHEIWETYKIDFEDQDLYLSFRFAKNSMYLISIYTEDDSKYQTLLEELGGEKEYDWGKVSFSRDRKAGFDSILIIYDSPHFNS